MEAHIRILYRTRILTQIYLTLSTHCGLMKLISSSFWTSCNTLYLDVVMWLNSTSVQSVQLISCIQLFVTPWTAACQASLSITNSWRLLRLMSIESVMPSNHLILWRGQEGKDWKPEQRKSNDRKPRFWKLRPMSQREGRAGG